MKYTHYLSTPDGPVRGNFIDLPSEALQSARSFEKATGLGVTHFTRSSTDRYGFRGEVYVDLEDGSMLTFDTFGAFTHSQIFHTEDGKYKSVRSGDNIAKCSDHPSKRYRVVFDENICTTFITYEEASDILQDVAEGHGVVFTNNRNGRPTALPHHSIKRAILTEAPFGGHAWVS